MGQPIEIVEAAMNVSTGCVSRTLVSEHFPCRRITIERLELGTANLLEKWSSLHGFERCYLLILFHIGELRGTRTIERPDTLSKHLRDGRIGLAIRVENFDHLHVAGIVDTLMRKYSAGHREQGARFVRLQDAQASGPFTCASHIYQPRCGNGCARHHEGTRLEKLASLHLLYSIPFLDHLANLRMCSTSAPTTSGCPSKSGFDAIEALSPTEVPPFTMIIAMRWSLIELCHFRLRKFAGFGFRLPPAAPAPPPSTPSPPPH